MNPALPPIEGRIAMQARKAFQAILLGLAIFFPSDGYSNAMDTLDTTIIDPTPCELSHYFMMKTD